MHILTREREDESVCGVFSVINEGSGWRRFNLEGDGKEDRIQVLTYWINCTVWAFIPIDFAETAGAWIG